MSPRVRPRPKPTMPPASHPTWRWTYHPRDLGPVTSVTPTDAMLDIAGGPGGPGPRSPRPPGHRVTRATADRPPRRARLAQGVAVDSAGDLFIADTGNNVVREVNPSTGVITTVAGNGTGGYSGDGGPATAAELNAPTAVAVDAAGRPLHRRQRQ